MSIISTLRLKSRSYWSLVKSLQTGLLLLTGFAGYISARCPIITWASLLGLMGSLFLAISGSTILNMVYDRDIDSLMTRTCNRPLPSGKVGVKEATVLGAGLSILGVGWAFSLDPIYGMVVFAGWFFDVVVYTLWLKRKTPWSIVWGGIAGGMPILAGRVLGLGSVDWVGIFLALSVFLWIPTHIMTFSMRYRDDYARAGIPTFPSVYGDRTTRLLIASSSIASAIFMAIAMVGVGMTWGYLRLFIVLSTGLLVLAISSLLKPSLKSNFGLFKYASIFMLGSMMMVIIGVLA